MKVVCNKTDQGITQGSQYAVIQSFTAIDNEKRYMIENDYRRVETYPQSLFTVVIETHAPAVTIEENIPLLEMVSMMRRYIDRIEIRVRKESR